MGTLNSDVVGSRIDAILDCDGRSRIPLVRSARHWRIGAVARCQISVVGQFSVIRLLGHLDFAGREEVRLHFFCASSILLLVSKLDACIRDSLFKTSFCFHFLSVPPTSSSSAYPVTRPLT